MKLILSALALAVTLACLPHYRAAADEAALYARVTSPDVYLYEEADENSGLFILPETYFVKILSENGDYYAAEYLCDTPNRTPVRGYCRKTDVECVDYIPETPFLVYETQITFRSSSDDLPEGFIRDYTVDAAFYGTFSYGSSVCCYVEMEGRFGYVPASACSPIAYPPNTEHTDTASDGQPSDPSSAAQPDPVNIVLICALAVAALGAVWFLFRPAKKQAHPLDEDAEDFFC